MLATINQNGWNEIAGTVGEQYAIGSIFTCAVTVSDAVGDGNHNSAACRNVTIPVGNSGTGAPNILKATEVFTTIDDETTYDPLITSEAFWEDGRFNFSDKIHPEMTNTYGGVRWEGYQTGRYNSRWETNSYFIIEQDLIEDPNNPNGNWELVKAVTTSDVQTFGKAFYETSDGAVTRIRLSEKSDWQRVCEGMIITLPGTGIESTVSSLSKIYVSVASGGTDDYDYYVNLDTDLEVSETNGVYLTFSWNPINDLITTDIIYISVPPSGKRRKVRYTAWWPELTSGAQYGQKRFYENQESSLSRQRSI